MEYHRYSEVISARDVALGEILGWIEVTCRNNFRIDGGTGARLMIIVGSASVLSIFVCFAVDACVVLALFIDGLSNEGVVTSVPVYR